MSEDTFTEASDELLLDTIEQCKATIKEMQDYVDTMVRELNFRAGCPDVVEGSVPVKVSGDLAYTVTRKINRRVDSNVVRRLGNQIDIDTYFKEEYSLKLKPYKNADDGVKAALNTAITSKPGKPSITIRRKT